MAASRCSLRLSVSFGVLFGALAASSDAAAQGPVYFDGSTSNDFHTASNWENNAVPGGNVDDIISIDDGFSVTYAAGTTTLGYLRVGTADEDYPNPDTMFGRLTMTGGTLEVIGVNFFVLGRENLGNVFPPISGDYNRDSIVDGADIVLWQRTLGSFANLNADGDHSLEIDAPDLEVWKGSHGETVSGGEVIMTGDSILRANGAVIGERTKGLLSIGPNAQVDVRIWDDSVVPNQFGGTEDIRAGSWGLAYEHFGGQDGIDGNGLIDVQGRLNAKDMYLSEHGGKGEIRLAGGIVNLNGELIMDLCAECTSDEQLLAQRSSKVTIVGSGGSFVVGLDPDAMVVDPLPPPRDIRAASSTASFSFTADAGGVTPIVLATNTGEASGTARIDTAKLFVNLDAYTLNSPLTLIDAPANQLLGSFGSVTFLGRRTASLVYDRPSGDVILTNFVSSGASGLANVGAAPEPSSMILALIGGVIAAQRRRWQARAELNG